MKSSLLTPNVLYRLCRPSPVAVAVSDGLEEVAATVLFLLAEQSSGMTGRQHFVDGSSNTT
ncbi:hypothetical protein [Curtobacterium sp. MCPF17_052]|uniref:hypothetical protein n=1 Tax=Curtobacterium sp. MCPF17_052 TaxID=2175655 RepID=UPI000DA72AF1|nr:hypothetical protein [Curtobacterium sp. MCPF17_052]WIB13472.1 hypothetical protein DEJ36_06675 [Curtobacterium sp. MCPF17_052]